MRATRPLPEGQSLLLLIPPPNSPHTQKVKEEQKDAEAIGTKLTNLHNSVHNFQATLKTALEKDSAIAKQIEEVRGRIAGVDKKIAEFESLVSVEGYFMF